MYRGEGEGERDREGDGGREIEGDGGRERERGGRRERDRGGRNVEIKTRLRAIFPSHYKHQERL